jgi:hypothetical protein
MRIYVKHEKYSQNSCFIQDTRVFKHNLSIIIGFLKPEGHAIWKRQNANVFW